MRRFVELINMAAGYLIFLFACGCASGNGFGSDVSETHANPRDLVTIDNGIIRVGVDTARGGSIAYLSGELWWYV